MFDGPSLDSTSTATSATQDELHQSTQKLCRFFAAGKRCRFGDKCKWSHDAPSINSDSPVKQEEGGSVGFPNKSKRSPTKSTEDTPTIDENGDGKQVEKKMCFSFKKHGRCRFSARCRFLHELPAKTEDGSHSELASSSDDRAPLQPESSHQEDSITQQSDQSRPNERSSGTSEMKTKKCRYFSANGRCRAGDKCRFWHVQRQNTENTESIEPVNPDNPQLIENQASQPIAAKIQNKTESKTKRRRLCRFFKAGSCTMAEKCRFFHPPDFLDLSTNGSKDSELDKVQNDEHVHNAAQRKNVYPRSRTFRPTVSKKIKKLSELSGEQIQELRKTEIGQLLKKFSKDRRDIQEDGTRTIYRVVFSPTDPEWPFDVNHFELEVSFPEDYPKEKCEIALPLDQELPDIVLRHINKNITEWVEDKHSTSIQQDRADLMFRPFLRWFDRKLEDLFTAGARKYKMEIVAEAAGFEFIPFEQLQGQQTSSQDENDDIDEEENQRNLTDVGLQPNRVIDGGMMIADLAINQEDRVPQSDRKEKKSERNEHRGTEIRLRGLELTENTATLTCTKISLSIQCLRCKGKSDVTTPPRRVNSITCERCQNQQLLTYRPSITHQYSSTLGYLDIDGCIPFDLISIECELKAGCMNCSKEMNFKGVHFGQAKDMWCRHCHKKLRIIVEAVRFIKLEPSEAEVSGKVHVVEMKKSKKVQKDPAIQEGKALPDNGTCKHYKKSYRWLRFPCCGKTYPCDVCHDDVEDHEMTLANRMICGFCCREQQYAAEKPCVTCNSSMTRIRSAHWEGGMGCRNKTVMSRNDKQKYASSNKTVSRKQQTKTQPTKKKVEKK
ncbi:uncharacterized protein LOC144443367 [Glandiceps talaboti]